MSESTIKPISAEERRLWERQNLADLLYWAELPFSQKLQMVEDMEELAKSMHGGKLPPPPEARANPAPTR